MNKTPLQVAFLWHQHQPYYKNARNVYHMPWVRFHGTKDYLDMLLILKDYPQVKQNINLVPSLLLQLEDYVANDARDNIMLLTEKPAAELTDEEKTAILENFFLANVDTMIRPYPRYYQLYQKYKYDAPQIMVRDRHRLFSEQDFLDLQVWYNLTWIGMESRKRKAIQALFKKGTNFSEKDKQVLLKEIRHILKEIIPTHKKLWEKGQIELSLSPFYHPILPLLIDSNIARVSDPNVTLPPIQFQHPEDAEVQLDRAKAYFQEKFGRLPIGVWPSEGSVSEAAAELIARKGFRWIATDEGILSRTLGVAHESHKIYQPHRFVGKSHSIAIFFRDHYLSDSIGFVYSGWDEDSAVTDFFQRLYSIRNRLIQKFGEDALFRYVVSVILDGENCWEYYPNDGHSFRRKLFARLSEDPLIQTVTFQEFLEKNSGIPEIRSLHPGSWINSNFNIWIGSEEDNRAWELLKRTRDDLVRREKEALIPEEDLKEAWERIYIAEGSDWCWWYGDEHSSSQDAEFDQLYREHLIRVYEIIGVDVPPDLYQTIKKSHFDRFQSRSPVNFIYPTLDGRDSYYFEWLGAAVYEGSKVPQTAMHQVSRIIRQLYVGFNDKMLFLRVDFFNKPDPLYEYVLAIKMPRPITVVISPLRGIMELFEYRDEKFEKTLLEPTFKLDQILEVGIPFEAFKVKPGDRLGFQLHVKLNNQLVEKFPHINIIEVEVPDEYYELKEWVV